MIFYFDKIIINFHNFLNNSAGSKHEKSLSELEIS